jgi:hypothetical protein
MRRRNGKPERKAIAATRKILFTLKANRDYNKRCVFVAERNKPAFEKGVGPRDSRLGHSTSFLRLCATFRARKQVVSPHAKFRWLRQTARNRRLLHRLHPLDAEKRAIFKVFEACVPRGGDRRRNGDRVRCHSKSN